MQCHYFLYNACFFLGFHMRGGRLDKVEGIYIPGRDSHHWLSLIGWLTAGGTLAGVLLHGLVRIVRRKN